MKAKPIEDLLKHCIKVVDECEEFNMTGNHYLIAKTWVDAITCVATNYDCTPRERG